MKNRTLHFIYNPKAGHGNAEKNFSIAKSYLDSRKISYTVAGSTHIGHAIELAKQAVDEGKKYIVVVGGDGSIREVAQGIIYSGVPLGILPGGTGNDLARVLGIPTDPIKAIDLILNTEPSEIDAAKANEQVYVNVSGLGFDVEVLISTEKYKEKLNNSFSYIIGLIKALLKLTPHNITIRTENRVIKTNALVALVGNGRYIGGGLKLTPLGNLDDGLLDICVVDNVNRVKILPILAKALKGKHIGLEVTRYFRAKEITITSDSELSVQLDGEIIEKTPVTFKILPKALLIPTGDVEPYENLPEH